MLHIHALARRFALLRRLCIELLQTGQLVSNLDLQPAWHGLVKMRVVHALGEVILTRRL